MGVAVIYVNDNNVVIKIIFTLSVGGRGVWPLLFSWGSNNLLSLVFFIRPLATLEFLSVWLELRCFRWEVAGECFLFLYVHWAIGLLLIYFQ